MARFYCPKRGDIVWLSFSPQTGHEQAGHRPALTLSPEAYNHKVGLGLFCPITSQVKGYPFEVLIPDGLEIKGAVLSDQVRSLDWKARQTRFCCAFPQDSLLEVLSKLGAILNYNR